MTGIFVVGSPGAQEYLKIDNHFLYGFSHLASVVGAEIFRNIEWVGRVIRCLNRWTHLNQFHTETK